MSVLRGESSWTFEEFFMPMISKYRTRRFVTSVDCKGAVREKQSNPAELISGFLPTSISQLLPSLKDDTDDDHHGVSLQRVRNYLGVHRLSSRELGSLKESPRIYASHVDIAEAMISIESGYSFNHCTSFSDLLP